MPRDFAALPVLSPDEQASEIEVCLLGTLLFDNRLYEQVAGIIGGGHFSYPAHGQIFEAMGKLIADGKPANPLTLKRTAEDDPIIAAAGGPRYLVQLSGYRMISLQAPYYAEQIADACARRVLLAELETTKVDVESPSLDRNFTDVLADHERRVAAMHDEQSEERPIMSAHQAVELALAMVEEVWKADGSLIGTTTGLRDLDRAIGGLHRTDLVVVAGRPGMGKSALATTIAEAAARSGRHIYFASLEMSNDQLVQRQLAAISGVSAERQRMGPLSRDDVNALCEAGERLRPLPITFDDKATNSVASLRARLRRHKRRHGLDVVIVDYLQLLLADRAENRVQEVSAITRALKALAKEFDVPVVALSQLSRAVEQRDDKRPMLSDLRDSGSIEQDADVVMFLYRDEYYAGADEPQRREKEKDVEFAERCSTWNTRCQNARGVAEILIRKNRHGATRTVKVHFDAARTAFGTLAWGRDHHAENSVSSS